MADGAVRVVDLLLPAWHPTGSGVYFIQCEQSALIKIGFSHRISARLHHVLTNSPFDARLVGVIFGATVEDERALHFRFREHRWRREWFRPAPELLWFIRRLDKAPPRPVGI